MIRYLPELVYMIVESVTDEIDVVMVLIIILQELCEMIEEMLRSSSSFIRKS